MDGNHIAGKILSGRVKPLLIIVESKGTGGLLSMTKTKELFTTLCKDECVHSYVRTLNNLFNALKKKKLRRLVKIMCRNLVSPLYEINNRSDFIMVKAIIFSVDTWAMAEHERQERKYCTSSIHNLNQKEN